MFDFLISFLGITEVPFWASFAGYVCLSFLAVWLVANFVSLFIQIIFSFLR